MTTVPPAPDARFEQLRKLTEISRALTYTMEPAEVLPLATVRAADLMEAQSALLMLTDEEGMLRVRATHGLDQAVAERVRERLDENLIERLQGVLGGSLRESFLGVPLVAHGAVIGLLAVVRPPGRTISDEDEWLLSAVADQVAVALENARLEAEVRRQRESRARAEEGEDAHVARDRALATLSHDLRSPLNAIDSYAELMEMEILGSVSDRQREALGRIRMSGRHLLAVLENVLEMARINAGVIRVDAGAVPAAAVVEEAVLMVRPSAEGKDQALDFEIEPGLTVAADADRLRQVLVNLLANAVKYTPPGGAIRVHGRVEAADGRTWGIIGVSDTGPGIPSDKLQSVFQPYYRIMRHDGEGQEGTGLGLAISRELVRRMEGEIEVESELGSGSIFAVRLPIA